MTRKRRGYYSNEKVDCARSDCDKQFKKRVHNQKYHSKRCCQLSTNEKLLKKYHDGKKPVAKGRLCSEGCGTVLSIYNRTNVCAPCDTKLFKEKLRRKI